MCDCARGGLSRPVNSASRKPPACRRDALRNAGAPESRSAPSAPPAVRLRRHAPWRAGATSVLPEPTSPCSSRIMRVRRGEIGGANIAPAPALAPRSAEGKAPSNFLGYASIAAISAAAGAAHVRAHQDKRELIGEQFVIGEPYSRRGVRRNRIRRLRDDGPPSAPQRNSGEFGSFAIACACHSGSTGRPRQRPAHRFGQHPRIKSFGQAVDRLDQRHVGEAFGIQDAVGMDHLAMAVPKFEACRKSSAFRPEAGCVRSIDGWQGRRRAEHRPSRLRREPYRALSSAARAGGDRRPGLRSSRSDRAAPRRPSAGCGDRSSLAVDGRGDRWHGLAPTARPEAGRDGRPSSALCRAGWRLQQKGDEQSGRIASTSMS